MRFRVLTPLSPGLTTKSGTPCEKKVTSCLWFSHGGSRRTSHFPRFWPAYNVGVILRGLVNRVDCTVTPLIMMQTEGHAAALRDSNRALLVCGWCHVRLSVSENSGGALIRAKRCARGIPPTPTHGHGNLLLRQRIYGRSSYQ